MWPRGLVSRDRLVLLLAVVAPPVVSVLLVPFRTDFTNTQFALVLVVVVVAVAANGLRVAGFLAALSAGVWFDFFFTQPYQRLTVADRSDVETLILLLLVGIAVTELAVWGRRQQTLASREAGYLAGIQAAAESGATGGSSSVLIRDVSGQLTQALGLRGCHFEPGVAGLGNPPRLQRDGKVVWNRVVWDVEREGLPVDREIELLVESGGRLRGRFLLSAASETRVSLAQRLVAVTLADQVGAALR
jgi:K+-sensing histidine kinase KdpD